MADATKPPSLDDRLSALRRQMEDGLPRRATELRAAADRLARGDGGARDEIRRLAHKLRGTAGSYGHVALGEQAAEVEALAREAQPAALVSGALGLVIAIGRVARAGATSATEGAAARRASEATSALPTLEGRRLLAIDDDASTRRLLELTLRSMGRCEASILEAPDEALALLARERFDLVIVDAMMPATTGLAFAEALRACDHGADVAIAFLSAASHEELGWTLPVGTTWLRKPFRPRELLVALVSILDGGGDSAG